MPAFQWLKKILPNHIAHQYEEEMAKKSKVFGLPIQFKNEAKYEDCVDIMDNYIEQLTSLHTEAFGTLITTLEFACDFNNSLCLCNY